MSFREGYYELRWLRIFHSIEAFYDWQDLKIAEIEVLAIDLSQGGLVS